LKLLLTQKPYDRTRKIEGRRIRPSMGCSILQVEVAVKRVGEDPLVY